jgi:hypothetical protein
LLAPARAADGDHGNTQVVDDDCAWICSQAYHAKAIGCCRCERVQALLIVELTDVGSASAPLPPRTQDRQYALASNGLRVRLRSKNSQGAHDRPLIVPNRAQIQCDVVGRGAVPDALRHCVARSRKKLWLVPTVVRDNPRRTPLPCSRVIARQRQRPASGHVNASRSSVCQAVLTPFGESGVEPQLAVTIGYAMAHLPLCHSRLLAMAFVEFPQIAGD